MDSLSREVVKIFSSLSGSQPSLQGNRTTQDDAFSRESIARLEQAISDPNTSTAIMKDNMIKLIYGEMMGYPVQFGAIYALKLAQSGQTIAEKRAGYVACSLLLLDGNELNIMLVNTLQKDLSSSNYHHVVVALITLCNMTLTDVIPALVTPVLQVLSHPQETVRKRAVIALKRFYIQLPELVLPYLSQLKDALRDPEPSVMSATLGLFAVIVKDHPEDHRDLVPILIRILRQVIEGRLPKGYLYHGMPAPWIQVRCLQLMASLGYNDLNASRAMTPVVMAAYHKAAQGVDAAFAVLLEIIRTLNTFHQDIILDLVQSTDPRTNPLLVISRFATSTNPNLRYLGIVLLDQVLPQAWCDTWWTDSLLTAVVESLDNDRDPSLQRRTLDLLFRLLTRDNSVNILERLTIALHGTDDPLQREKLLGQILRGSESFGQSEEWYVDSIFALFTSQNLAITLHAAEQVIAVLERGASNKAFVMDKLCLKAVQKSLQILTERGFRLSSNGQQQQRHSQGHASYPLAYLVTWTLGEYGLLLQDANNPGDACPPSRLVRHLARCLMAEPDPIVQALVLSAMTKLVNACETGRKKVVAGSESDGPEMRKKKKGSISLRTLNLVRQQVLMLQGPMHRPPHSATPLQLQAPPSSQQQYKPSQVEISADTWFLAGNQKNAESLHRFSSRIEAQQRAREFLSATAVSVS